MPTLSDDLDVLRQQTDDALDRAEREPDRRSQDWRELTPVINVNVGREKKDSSVPPSSRKRGSALLGIAAIITALGGAAGVQQCASQARQSVPVKLNAPKL